MAKITRTATKAYFQTDDIPTESQYIDVFDSTLNFTDDVVTTVGATGSDVLIPSEQAVREALNLKADSLTADQNYVSDAQLTVIGNTSGTNTGDNAVNSNYSGLVTNATHTGEVTGATALTVDKTAITGKTAVTAVGTDYILISDTSDTGNLKKALLSDVSGGAPEGTAVLSTGEAGGTKFLREDGDGTCSWQTPSVSGDVVGPASATDNAVARFDTTTGKLLQNSAVTIADTSGDITGGKYNKVTVTAPATGSTLTIADGQTLTVNGSATITNGTHSGTNTGDNTVATALTGTPSITVATVTTTGNIELGHASDTTIARSGAGVITVEGVTVDTISASNTLTNKTLTSPVIGTIVSASNGDINLSPNGTGKVVSTNAHKFTKTASFASEVDNGNSGTTKTIDWTAGNKQKITTTGSCTLTFTAPTSPCNLQLRIIHEASTTAYTYTWPATAKWPAGTAATTTNTSGAVDIVSLYYDGTNYYSVGNADLK